MGTCHSVGKDRGGVVCARLASGCGANCQPFTPIPLFSPGLTFMGGTLIDYGF